MIELESERLFIREITAHDLEKVLPVYLEQPGLFAADGRLGR